MTPSPQDDQDRDQAAQYADMLLAQQQAEEALRASIYRPLTGEERAAIAFVGHISLKRSNHNRTHT